MTRSPAEFETASRMDQRRPGLSRLQVVVLVAGVGLAIASGRAAYEIRGPYGINTGSDPCTYRKYDARTGQLTMMLCDTNRNGVTDIWFFFEPDGAHTVELDPNEDGLADRAEEYGVDQQLRTIGYSRRADGSFERVDYFEAGRRIRQERPAASGSQEAPPPKSDRN